ncbi:MAG: stage II sporulation protein P [Patescibacteria group bacterium]
MPSLLYRRALPYWAALALTAAAARIVRPAPGGAGGLRLLAGIEPVTVIKAILLRRNQLGQVMLALGLPALARRADEQDPVFRDDLDLPGSFWLLATGVRYHSHQETLRAGLPILGRRAARPVPAIRLAPDPPPLSSPGAGPGDGVTAARAANEPALEQPGHTVILLHTHTSESYLPISGRDHLENAAGDIVQVGDYLARALEAEGFTVVHDRTIHDQVPFREAYKRSLVTAAGLLSAHPEPLALIDLHRDATPGVVGTVELGGEKVARLALVVGTDRLGLSHPDWRRNLEFANNLRDATERLYPGLLARIDLAEARYNQHLFPRAIIIEVGNQYSTSAEVYRAAACLARILAEVAPAYPGAGAAAPAALSTQADQASPLPAPSP